MRNQKVGDLIDSLGVTLDIDGEDMVTDVVVIAKVVTGAGQVAVTLGTSESSSWLDQLALVTAASDIVRSSPPEFKHDPEE